MRDPFAVMGLPPTATRAEIKARYRELARTHHPDAGPSGSSARMAEINRAYDELSRDLEGCRRRSAAGQRSSSRRPGTSSSGSQARPRARPVRRSKPESRAVQWKEWLDRARHARRDAYSTGREQRPRATGSPIRVSPSILTLCRHHGPQDLRVSGEAARGSTVLFSSRHFDVERGSTGESSQLFRVRLTGDLPGPDSRAYLRVRSGSVIRPVPVYEFSCPSAEGSCAFAS